MGLFAENADGVHFTRGRSGTSSGRFRAMNEPSLSAKVDLAANGPRPEASDFRWAILSCHRSWPLIGQLSRFVPSGIEHLQRAGSFISRLYADYHRGSGDPNVEAARTGVYFTRTNVALNRPYFCGIMIRIVGGMLSGVIVASR